MSDEVHHGLEDVLVAETDICYIDSDQGEVGYRGYPVQQLGREVTFEEVLYLLWYGNLPTEAEYERFTTEIRDEREVHNEVLALLENLAAHDESPMMALRTAVSGLSAYDTSGSEDHLAVGRRISAKMPTIIAAFDRFRKGEDPIQPRDDLSHAANFLYMLTGSEPESEMAGALDTTLILHAEHGINASTLTARTTASTLADVYSAVTGAIGALSGELHGGANQEVMEMLLQINESGQDPVEWVESALADSKLIYGFGHRVYRVKDRRVDLLSEQSERLAEVTGETRWHEYCSAIEEYMADVKGLAANIDLYTAPTYYQMGIPVDIYTSIFGMSRISGWSAHLCEQYRDNRLIRPCSRYTGPRDVEFVPLEDR